MPERSLNFAEKLADIERRFRDFARLADRAAEREARLTWWRNPRLAVTCKQTSAATYPDIKDAPNTYWIKFLDSTFTRTEGQQTRTDTARQTDGKTKAHLPDGQLCDYLPEGTFCYVLYDNRRWWIIRYYTPDRLFELKYDHTPGATTTVYRLAWDGAALSVDADCEFDASDSLGVYRGRAKDKFASPHNQGSRGWARYFPEPGTERWEMHFMQPCALWIEGLTYSAVQTTDATFDIDGVHVMQPVGGLICDQDPAAAMTIQNTFDHRADSNATAVAAWDETSDHWDGIQVKCPVVS